MKADFSRLTFQKRNHYRRVLNQQGRVEIDADGNEQIAIDDHICATTSTDVIGQAGYPDGTLPGGAPVGGFALGIGTNGTDLTISAGRMYVDGLLLENDAQTTLLTQPDMPGVTLAELGVAQAGAYAVYLDVWERLITALDNPLIRETALGGPDTSVRTKLVWQVKLFPAPTSGAAALTCANVGDPWVAAAATTGTLAASSSAPGSDLPCILPPETGYQSLQNQLYRAEIHTGGQADDTATFKWSRENGSVVCLITAPPSSNGAPPPTTVTGPTFYVTGLITDPSLGLAQGDWVELTDDNTELINGAGTLYQVATPPTNGLVTLTITGTQTTPTVTLALHPKLRRWDQSGTGLTNGVVPVTTAAPIELEGGVQVQFSSGTYQVGDYWLIPARTATSIQQGYVQWPVDANNPVPQPPVGIKHHYATLGLVEFTTTTEPGTFGGLGGATKPTDCRLPFPPLTGLTPQQSLSPCTIVVQPGPGWEQPILNYFQQGGTLDADICFPVGQFPVMAPLAIANAGNIRVSGAGWGTQIIGASGAGGPETVLQFEGCSSVTVRDLYAETSVVSSAGTTVREPSGKSVASRSHINGTLTFSDCVEVTVEGAALRCGSAISARGASCITVSSDVTDANVATGAGSVRIRSCSLNVGENQVGIQLVHQLRAVVEDNEILLDPDVPPTTLAERLADTGYLAIARRYHLLPSASPQTSAAAQVKKAAAKKAGATPPPPSPPTPTPAPKPPATPTPPASTPAKPSASRPAAVLNVGNKKISIAVSTALASTWQTWLDANAPKEFATPTDALNYLKKQAVTFLTDPSSRAGMSSLGGVMTTLNAHRPLAGRGIVVGGQSIGDLHILDNAITGVMMGISVGVSHHASSSEVTNKQRTPDHMQTIRIVGNVIACSANDIAVGYARFGIFVGNANSLDVEGNRITLAAAGIPVPPAADAIRVVGYLGNKAIIRGNHTSTFGMGIRVIPLHGDGPGIKAAPSKGGDYTAPINHYEQWLVIDNIIEGATTPSIGPFENTTPPAYIDAAACLQVNNVALTD